MRFASPLTPGRLIRRWNRFLSEVTLDTGETVIAHCPNPGSMMGLSDPGLRVWVEGNDNPKRKLRWAWRLVELPGGHWAGIDTSVPNAAAGEALRAGRVPGLAGYTDVRPEVRYGTKSRVDWLLTGPGLPRAFVEVKNVHLRRAGTWAEFPDSVTLRGAKHLHELTLRVAAGDRAVMLYVVQRTDCDAFRLAPDLDPAYARAFDAARAGGVEMIAMATTISPEGVQIARPLPIDSALQGRG